MVLKLQTAFLPRRGNFAVGLAEVPRFFLDAEISLWRARKFLSGSDDSRRPESGVNWVRSG